MSPPLLLLGTRKGLLIARHTDAGWTLDPTVHFAGVPVPYAARDPRDGALWAALEHGHWGPKLHRSTDGGNTWVELPCPAYPPGELTFDPWTTTTSDAALCNIWVVGFGGADQPGRVYVGTNPGGLFRSDDHGASWSLVRGLWDHPSRLGQAGGRPGWFGGGRDTPGLHSITVDPRDSRRMMVGVSCGGTFHTEDDGATWAARNRGLPAPFLPDPENNETGHDPHFVTRCPAAPDVLWQQNHVGIFKSTDCGRSWEACSTAGEAPHFGFPIAVDPSDPERAWVVPAVSDEQRQAADQRLVVCETRDGGASWLRLASGLPSAPAFDLVYRHALDVFADGARRTLAFGSTTGNVFIGHNGGARWTCLSHHLPPVYSVRFG